MTPPRLPKSVTIICNGEREVIDGRLLNVVLDLFEKWHEAINRTDVNVKITVNCRGRDIKSSVELYK